MSDEWYIERRQQIAGPFTSQQLKELAASGRLTRVDGIRKGPVGAFVAASKARGLFGGDTTADRPNAPNATSVAGVLPKPSNTVWIDATAAFHHKRAIAVSVAVAGSLLGMLLYVRPHGGSALVSQETEHPTQGNAVASSGLASPDNARGTSPTALHIRQPCILIDDGNAVDLSADGNLLLVTASNSNALWDVPSRNTMNLPVATQWGEGAFSWNSKRLATYLPHQSSVIVMDLVDKGFSVSGTFAVSTNPSGTDLHWSPDNRHIVAIRTDGRPIETKWFWRLNQTSGKIKPWADEEDLSREGLQFASLEPVVLYAQIIDTASVNQPSLPLPHRPKEAASGKHRGPDRVNISRYVRFTPKGDAVIIDVTVNEDLSKGESKRTSLWFDVLTGELRHSSPPVEGMSESGQYYVTFDEIRSQGKFSRVIEAVCIWEADTHKKIASLPVKGEEDDRFSVDAGFSSDEECFFVSTPSDGECKRAVYSVASGEFIRTEDSFTAITFYPTGVRQPWQIETSGRGPMELWAGDQAWPSVVLGSSDEQSREAKVSRNGKTVITRIRSGQQRNRVEVWVADNGDSVNVLGFRQEHCDDPMLVDEQYFKLTEAERKAGWQLPLNTQSVAPKVSKERYQLLREGMTAEQAYEVLGGLPHKMLLKMSSYESGPNALRGIRIIDRYHVYAGESPDSVVILHLRKDAELTNHRGILVAFSQRGL